MPAAPDLFRALPLAGKAIALILSISAHAALALVAVHGGPHTAARASLPAEAVVELTMIDLPLTEGLAPVTPVTPSVRASHHHDYPVPPEHDTTPHHPATRHLLPQSTLPNVPAAARANEPPLQSAPRFVMAIGALAHADRELGAASAVATASPPATAAPAAETSVDTPAKRVAGGAPSYTPEAAAAGVEADVPLEIVVDGTGSVVSARVLSRVGYGLDEAALRSVRSYRFAPARRAGRSVAVRMRWLMQFQLR
jgi:TonB family protein